MAKEVDVSECPYLVCKFEFFKDFHYCQYFSDEENKVECEHCYDCPTKMYLMMKQENKNLKRKLKLRRVK